MSLLVKYSSVYMSMPNSQSIPPHLNVLLSTFLKDYKNKNENNCKTKWKLEAI